MDLNNEGFFEQSKQEKSPEERNFCSRCGKRQFDGIHTCTPPSKQEQEVDWKDMYEKEKRRSAMWVAKYEKDIGPLERAVPAKQEHGEPVAWKLMPRDATYAMLKAMDECSTEGYDERLYAGHAASVYMAAWDALDTHPPQRKPLTDEQIVLIVGECAASHQHTDIHFARAIEAKLKELNT